MNERSVRWVERKHKTLMQTIGLEGKEESDVRCEAT